MELTTRRAGWYNRNRTQKYERELGEHPPNGGKGRCAMNESWEHTKWAQVLPPEITAQAQALCRRAQAERDAGRTVYPAQAQIFRALALTPPEQVRAVIVGQDPYHEPGQACGLAFSVQRDAKLPRSLNNIYRELADDLQVPPPPSGDLSGWAAQGVLLLNTVLTVERGKAGAHKSWGWQTVTQAVLRACSRLPQPLVYILWGSDARALCAELHDDAPNHCAVESTHPSPLSARRAANGCPAFFGSRPFSRTNAFLTAHHVPPIDWTATG